MTIRNNESKGHEAVPKTMDREQFLSMVNLQYSVLLLTW